MGLVSPTNFYTKVLVQPSIFAMPKCKSMKKPTRNTPYKFTPPSNARADVLENTARNRPASPAPDSMNSPIIPIAELKLYKTKWFVQAVVTSKSDVRKYNNGAGQFFQQT